jgi:cytochrome c-type biogenesis protein CcmE
MKDQDGQSRKVILDKSKPQGFEMSESVVIIGRADGEVFRAEELLMKCPSKYNEENHMIQEAGTSGI